WLRGAMFDNIGLKFLSMVLAVTVFLLVNTDKDREISARVGVSYTLPEDKVLVSERIDEVRVTIKGAWRRLRKFDEREIDRINLDLRRASSGEIAITNDMIHLPSGVSVTAINPRSVRVVFAKRVDKIVEIIPAITGQPEHGYKVLEVKPVPATIKLRGGETTLAALTAVRTHEIDLDGRADSFTAQTEVVPPEGVDVVGTPQIGVLIHVDEELVTRKLPGVSVVVRGDSDAARWRAVPPQVDVTLTGALLGVEKARGSLVPVVRLPSDGKQREAEVTIDGLPPGIGVKVSPEHVKLVPVKQAPVAPPPQAP
ncbi:MAG TPA: CdaR family protein, partial [Kofleriaceae bacterium]|nr:CdaR family protein [Kofleriaceae bacterium]